MPIVKKYRYGYMFQADFYLSYLLGIGTKTQWSRSMGSDPIENNVPKYITRSEDSTVFLSALIILFLVCELAAIGIRYLQ